MILRKFNEYKKGAKVCKESGQLIELESEINSETVDRILLR